MWSKRKNRIAVHDLDDINLSEVEARFRPYDEARERILVSHPADPAHTVPEPAPYDFGVSR